MKAAEHFGENCENNLFTDKNTDFEELKALCDITQTLILEQKLEIKHATTIEGQFTLWMRSTLAHDIALKWAKAKAHVYSDSVLCLGRMHGHPEAKGKLKGQLQYFQESNEHKE